MYRFLARPKWIGFTLLVALAAVTMVNLGFWQLRRLDERRTFNTLVENRTQAAPVALSALADDPPEQREWRSVDTAGAYDGATDEVPTAGGYFLVTPFLTEDGTTIYVNRGSIGSADTAPSPPAGRVELRARFRTAPTTAVSVPDGALFVDLVASAPSEPTVSPRPLPTLDEGPHLSYAAQWFIFSVCVLIGWVLAVRRSARSRAAETIDGATGTTSTTRSKHQAVPWQDDRVEPPDRTRL